MPLPALAVTLVPLHLRRRSKCSSPKAATFASKPIVTGLANPWGLAFLPDGRMLVTERPGRMRIVARDGTLSQPLAGVPKVAANNQGGLLDVVLDRDFAKNSTIYFCYSDPVPGGAQTALARARLDAGATPRLARRQAHLPAGRPALERTAFRLPHRAGARRQPVSHHRRPLRAIAIWRRPSTTISAR